MDEPQSFPFEVPPEKLLPRARAQYDELLAKEGSPLPIVIEGTNIMGGEDDYIRLHVGEDHLGRKAVVAGDEVILWSEEYVRRFHMGSDADIASRYTAYPNAAVVEAIEYMAAQKNLVPPPRILSSMNSGEAIQSREGTMYILLDPNMPAIEAIAVASHELGHLLHGNQTAESLARVHNLDSIEVRRAQETKADALAKELGHGPALAAFLEKGLPYYQKQARENDVSLEEAMDTLNPYHPRIPDRVRSLKDEPARGPQ